MSPLIADQVAKFTHNRTNSTTLTKAVSVVSIVHTSPNTNLIQPKQTRSSTLCLTNLTSVNSSPPQSDTQQQIPSTSAQLQHQHTIDDNNFINNTFSFLDDLETNNNNENVNEFMSSKQSVLAEAPKQPVLAEETNKTDYENFPWHAIYPATDQPSLSSSNTISTDPTTTMNSIAKNMTKSKTLPPNKQLSSSFSSSPNNEETGLSTFYTNSKSAKQVAPKIKSPATIGVASGFSISETLKKLTNNLTGNSRNEPSVSTSLDHGNANISENRRRSVTRIISSDSLKNLKPSKGNSSSQNTNNSQSTSIFQSARY